MAHNKGKAHSFTLTQVHTLCHLSYQVSEQKDCFLYSPSTATESTAAYCYAKVYIFIRNVW